MLTAEINRLHRVLDDGGIKLGGVVYAAMSAKKNAPRGIKQLKAIGRWPAPKSAATGT